MFNKIDIFRALKSVERKIVRSFSMYEDLKLFSLLGKKISYLRVKVYIPDYIPP